MANAPREGSIAGWNPGNGGADAESKKAKFFSTEAHDAKDTMNATNDLKPHSGKSGTPKGPFGQKGKEF